MDRLNRIKLFIFDDFFTYENGYFVWFNLIHSAPTAGVKEMTGLGALMISLPSPSSSSFPSCPESYGIVI